MSLRSFSGQIELNAPVEKVFQHFTDSDQMAALLPPGLRFRILKRSTRHFSQGTSLEFEIRPFGLPLVFKLYVHSFSRGHHLAYVWQRGAASAWEHDAYFESLPNNQTRVTDCILYRLPREPLGTCVDRFWMRPWLRKIFEHRRKTLFSIFQEARPVAPPAPAPSPKGKKFAHPRKG